MTTPVNSQTKLVRALREAQARGNVVWEHPDFDKVQPGYHIAASKHNTGNAGDLNRFSGEAEERRFFATYSWEMVRRGFGVIRLRNNYPGDHMSHCHIETIKSASEQYKGRVKTDPSYPQYAAGLKVDGELGPATITAMQRWLGTPQDGVISKKSMMILALQYYLVTESYGTSRKLVDKDGKLGPATIADLQSHLGLKPDGKIDKGNSLTVRTIQKRLNETGYIYR